VLESDDTDRVSDAQRNQLKTNAERKDERESEKGTSNMAVST
jgi:hypothetical protein